MDTYAEGPRFAAEPWPVVEMRLTVCGMRRSEVLDLDWSNVDLETGVVTVNQSRGKTGKGNGTAIVPPKVQNSYRDVAAEAIHQGTLRALRALWLAQGRPESGLVVSDAAGQPVYPYVFSYRFKQLCAAAGIPFPGSIHNTRHTIATMLTEAGIPDNHGAALLGYDVATYRRFYVLADSDAAAEGAQAVGTLLSAL